MQWLNETSIPFNSISTNCKYITDSFFNKNWSLQTLSFSHRSMQFFSQSSSETSFSKLHLTSVASSKSSTTTSFSITASLHHAPTSSVLLMNLHWIIKSLASVSMIRSEVVFCSENRGGENNASKRQQHQGEATAWQQSVWDFFYKITIRKGWCNCWYYVFL